MAEGARVESMVGVLGGAGTRTRDFGLAMVGEPSGPGGSIVRGGCSTGQVLSRTRS